jgi:hypothetical protein
VHCRLFVEVLGGASFSAPGRVRESSDEHLAGAQLKADDFSFSLPYRCLMTVPELSEENAIGAPKYRTLHSEDICGIRRVPRTKLLREMSTVVDADVCS